MKRQALARTHKKIDELRRRKIYGVSSFAARRIFFLTDFKKKEVTNSIIIYYIFFMFIFANFY